MIKDICVCGREKMYHEFDIKLIEQLKELWERELISDQNFIIATEDYIECCNNYKQDNLNYLEQMSELKEV